jgi:hypothetical protein
MRSRDLYRHADRALDLAIQNWEADTHVSRELGVVFLQLSTALRADANRAALTEEFPDLEPDPERETADR